MRRYVDTPTARLVLGAAEWSADSRQNVLITGPAGVGKTHALKEAARRDKRAVLITMAPARHSMRGVLSMVLEAFRLDSSSMHIGAMADVLDHRMPYEAAAGRYLVVDEAQLLPAGAMRQLLTYSDHDEWPLPIVLAGNEHALKKTRANAAAYDQIRSRMTKHVQIRAMSTGDVEAFCVDWNVEGREGYAAMQAFGAGRNCREIDKLLIQARQFAGATGPIRAGAIGDAITALYGRDLTRKIAAEKEVA